MKVLLIFASRFVVMIGWCNKIPELISVVEEHDEGWHLDAVGWMPVVVFILVQLFYTVLACGLAVLGGEGDSTRAYALIGAAISWVTMLIYSFNPPEYPDTFNGKWPIAAPFSEWPGQGTVDVLVLASLARAGFSTLARVYASMAHSNVNVINLRPTPESCRSFVIFVSIYMFVVGCLEFGYLVTAQTIDSKLQLVDWVRLTLCLRLHPHLLHHSIAALLTASVTCCQRNSS